MSDYIKEYVEWSEETMSKTFHYDANDSNENELRSIVEEVVKNLDVLVWRLIHDIYPRIQLNIDETKMSYLG